MHFRSEGSDIFVDPVDKVDANGKVIATSLGFRLLTIDEWLFEREAIAMRIANLLNEHWKEA